MSKYLISVDIEGITGVVNKDFANLGGKYYELAKRYMTHDVNAVVQGILQEDKDAYIVVRDAHEAAVNLDLERLHPQAHLLQGWGPEMNMVAGVDTTFAGVFLVGFHAGGNNILAVLGHAFSSLVHKVKINEQLLNETGIYALCAGYYDVPVAFLSGDNFAVQEAKEQLGDIVTVVVKQSYARNSALSLPLTTARDLLTKNAALAVTGLKQKKFKPFKLAAPLNFEIQFYNIGFGISVFQSLRQILAFDETYSFDVDNFGVKFVATDALTLLQRLNLIMYLVFGIRAAG